MIANFTKIGDIIKVMFAIAMYLHCWFPRFSHNQFVLGLLRFIVEGGLRLKS